MERPGAGDALLVLARVLERAAGGGGTARPRAAMTIKRRQADSEA